ncbi:redoxin domain-containing protein [Nocardioides sp. dk4132]|uniref:TlpA family protein disulfide reductase n=1 Tax=unclassified Nocardioides TaxID=2615069 RepID=UPI0012977522|nr:MULTISPECIES: TlpA disulfide reductase family protein [unclassified Nocardioides]MQW74260.1 redoxin domain-containing protein [Nocardioides sp. dk4132]QGA06217.1 redoxin domain-containing protein [Nocardioides sp. dk884]
MSRRLRAGLVAGVLLASAALAGCAPDANPPSGERAEPSESNVAVDTPQLRRMKADAGVEPCRPGTATEGALPAVSLPCLGGGERVDLSTLEGPLVINFWSSTCPPCRKEMPVLQEFHETYGKQVPLIGIDFLDVMPEAAMELVERTGVTYPLLADPGGELQGTDLRSISLPTFVFLAEDGEVSMAGGGVHTTDDLVAMVSEHLGVDL